MKISFIWKAPEDVSWCSFSIDTWKLLGKGGKNGDAMVSETKTSERERIFVKADF